MRFKYEVKDVGTFEDARIIFSGRVVEVDLEITGGRGKERSSNVHHARYLDQVVVIMQGDTVIIRSPEVLHEVKVIAKISNNA